ncbi:MAG: hypothetical protein ACO3J6_08465, partial [Opitutales bacterium]
MALIKTGSELATPQLQPGAKFIQDGYGLVVGTLTFKIDKAGSSASIYRGAPCPITAFSYCKMHKASVEIGALSLDTWTAEYVGINTAVNSGISTDPQITGSQGLTSENITTHPNFFETATTLGFTGSPIAGVGTGSVTTPAYALVTGATGEYEGNNGATFEAATGRKFLGFKKAQYKDFYGKTAYLAPQCSISGIFYTTSSTIVNDHRNAVGKTSGNGTFAGKKLVPDYMGTSFTISGKNQL